MVEYIMHYHYKLLLTNPKIVLYLKSLTIRLNNFIQELITYFLSLLGSQNLTTCKGQPLILLRMMQQLSKKEPYDQLRPYKTSELHDIQITEKNTHFSLLPDDFPTPCSNTTSPSNDDSPPLIHESPPQSYNGNNETGKNKADHYKTNNNNNNNNKTDHNRTNNNNNNTNDNKTDSNSKQLKRGCKPNDVWKYTANGYPDELVSTILEEDCWLTGKHIDHAQWLLSKTVPRFKRAAFCFGLQASPLKSRK